MATAVNPVRNSAFHKIFNPQSGGCSGACIYTWNSTTRQYVLQPGDACSGPNCHPCAPTKAAIVRELVTLERSFPDPDIINYQCGGTTEESLDSVLGLFVDLLKLHYMFKKIVIGLGILSAVLLLAVIYLLVR
jgi:hypothetical protein